MKTIKQQVEVSFHAVGVKEAMIMCPFTTFVCDSIKSGKDITFAMTHRQCVAIGKILGELGFVNVSGENPLDLIQELEAKNLKSDIAEQRPE